MLCVQELFSRDAEAFFESARLEHAVAVGDRNSIGLRPVGILGSGLGLISVFPASPAVVRRFRTASGTDRLARKGAMFATIAVGDRNVDVVNVHLQAGNAPRAMRVRATQLSEVRRLIDELGAVDRDVVVCGDFNIDGSADARDDEYRGFRTLLHDFCDLGAEVDLPTFEPSEDGNELSRWFDPAGRPQRLDYILHRPAPAGPVLRPTIIERVLDRPLDETASPLALRSAWASDHYGLLATFSLAG